MVKINFYESWTGHDVAHERFHEEGVPVEIINSTSRISMRRDNIFLV